MRVTHPVRFIIDEDAGRLFWRVDGNGRPLSRAAMQKNAASLRRKRARAAKEEAYRQKQMKAEEERKQRDAETAALAESRKRERKAAGNAISEYERARLAKIQDNRRMMEELGLA